MKLGIVSLEYIPAANCKSWGFIDRNGSVDVSLFKTGEFTTLDFTELMCSFQEEWIDGPNGKHSEISIAGTIRTRKKSASKVVLKVLLSNNYIYRITAASGEKLLIGSIDFLPKFTFKNIIEGLTTSEYQFSISLKSTSGAITDTSV